MIRAFVAATVEDAVVRRRLAGARSLLPPVPGVRWIPEGQLHFTLKFLGDVEDESVPVAREAIRAVATGAGPFDLALEGLGAFPPRGPARVLWAGCGAGAAALSALAAAVEDAFVARGFPREARPFSPHLTLARVKDPDAGHRLARALASLPPEPFGTVSIREVVLFRSELTPRGAEYEELFRVALESAAAPQ